MHDISHIVGPVVIVRAILGLFALSPKVSALGRTTVSSFRGGVIAVWLLVLAVPAAAQMDERRVQFASGAPSATVEGRLEGDATVDYLLNARAGQVANISMAASTGIANFNLIAPSATNVAFFVGAQQGNQFEGVLPEDGDYRIREYLLGNQAPTTYRLEMIVHDGAAETAPAAEADAAETAPAPYPEPDRRRSDATPPYLSPVGISDALNIRAEPSLQAAVVGNALAGTVLRNHGCRDIEGRRWCEVERVDDDTARGWSAAEYLDEADAALRAGQGIFDAGGWIDCAQAPAAPLTPCGFGVARQTGGTATVVVTRPDGRRRALFFEDGEFLGADTSQADGYPEYGATKRGDLFTIRVGEARYEIPEAVVFGG